MSYSATGPRRLIAQIHNDGIAAIDCDSKEQIFVQDFNEAHNFLCDLIGLDDSLAAKYSAGSAIAVGMASENWAAWLALYQTDDADYVWLTLSKAGEREDCISALALTSKREAIAPVDEKPYMVSDCIGFAGESFEEGYSVVVRMTAENWALWLEQFEVADLDDETAALLCD